VFSGKPQIRLRIALSEKPTFSGMIRKPESQPNPKIIPLNVEPATLTYLPLFFHQTFGFGLALPIFAGSSSY
jgi:hypothetical protein